MKIQSFDFRIAAIEANAILLRPLTQEGRNWLHDNVAGETSWFGGNLYVEARYSNPLLNGILNEGLTIAPI